jgi:2,3-bisphosphoglycerate-dependent phosphoglycerate mutase
MTTLYFVRHAKVTYLEDDHTRPLSEEGKLDVSKVTKLFKDIDVEEIVSSPFIRAIHTIKGIAEDKGLSIECYDDLCERKVADGFINDFEIFVQRQWEDFDFKLDGGESLHEVQKRGNEVIRYILDIYKDKTVVIGTHGTFLSMQLNYYDSKYDFEFWKTMKMPDIFKFEFNGLKLLAIENLKI